MAKAAKKSSTKPARKAVAKASEPVATPVNAMDYPEHEKTYDVFLWLTRWTVLSCLALLLAMMFGFYGGGGLLGGGLAFIVLMIVAFFIL